MFVTLLTIVSLASAIPNPASQFCINCGYCCEIRTDPQGGQFGVCVFPDGSECEEWSFYRKCNSPQSCDGDCNCPWPCPKRIIYVDDDGPADFNNIQAATDDTNDGDTIIVKKGIYFENINFRGKNIILTSTDPKDPTVVAATIIDGNNLDSVVTFAGTENRTCVLSGFTVRNGYANYGAGICGGTWEKQTHAEIRNNMIAANTLWYGGALDYCYGTIQNNVVSGTIILCDGGAIFDCQGIIQNNTILDNPIGLIGCNGIIQNNTICDNVTAVAECGGIIQNNIISGNSGYGLVYCNGIIQNNTISGNAAGIYRGDEATIRNNIISANSPYGGLIYCYGLIQYNLISGWTEGGVGNIDSDPCFADPNGGDYHLKSQAGRWDANEGQWTKDNVTSPCIDAGDMSSPIGLEPFPNGGIINMGSFGGTVEASKSYFGEPPCETIIAGDINGDCIVNLNDFAIMAFHWLEEH